MVVDQETEGNIAVLFLRKFPSNKVCAIKRLAEEPEFTNKEFLTLIFLKICFSNFFVIFD